MTTKELNDIFTSHDPSDKQRVKYKILREQARCLAIEINSMCPDSREKSLALTNLQSTIMFANAAIAIHDYE